ncbi:hypothetical protein JKY79_02890, partial [Candidatus Babeliales bacterium]|nr:hypothetical protein [Candidatus Babeliales bacterium]
MMYSFEMDQKEYLYSILISNKTDGWMMRKILLFFVTCFYIFGATSLSATAIVAKNSEEISDQVDEENIEAEENLKEKSNLLILKNIFL